MDSTIRLGYYVLLRMIIGLEQIGHHVVENNFFLLLSTCFTIIVRRCNSIKESTLKRKSNLEVQDSMVLTMHHTRQRAVVSRHDSKLLTLLSIVMDTCNPM